MNIKINNKLSFSYKKEPLIIAEISGNHGGSKKKFLQLVEVACKNKADLIKIQTYEPQDITIKRAHGNFKIKNGIWKGEILWNLYKKACTPFSWHKEAFEIAKKYDKLIFSSPFSIRAVDLLEKLGCKIYKIASFEITDLKLIDFVASKNKPIIISTGMAGINEIKTAIKIIQKYHSKIVILHCVSSYPTKLDKINLERIKFLKKKFPKFLIGLSDHTDDIYSSIAATTYGIVAIEKHLKISEKAKSEDSEFSITPNKLLNLKKATKEIHKSYMKNLDRDDKKSKKFRRSIFAKKNIEINEKFTTENIDTLRPSIGLCASKYFKVLGKKSRKKIRIHEPIYQSDIK